MMMPSAAAPALRRLAQFFSRPAIGGHNMRQLVKAGLLAFTDVQPVFGADLHQPPAGIGVTASASARNDDRFRVNRERGLEPFRLLDGMQVRRAVPMTDSIVTQPEYGES